MIWHDIQQNTTAWRTARLGIPTSSKFSEIITPGTGKLSKSSEGYANVLLYEWATGNPWIGYQSKRMEEGHEMEGPAVQNYEYQTGRDTSNGGFFTLDNGLAGASPDRKAGPGRILQVKCPDAPNHVGYMLTGKVADEYRTQLQGELYVSECEYNDIISHCVNLPPVIITVPRDEEYIKLLAAALDQFIELMLEKRQTLDRKFGPFPLPKPQPVENPHFITDADVEDYMEIVRTRS